MPALPGAVDDDDGPQGEKKETFLQRISRVTLLAVQEAVEHDSEDEEAENKKAKSAFDLGQKLGVVQPERLARRHDADVPSHPVRRAVYDTINSRTVDTLIGIVIMCNGITIGMEADINAKIPAGCVIRGGQNCVCENPAAVCNGIPVWVSVLEVFYFVIYLLELLARYFAQGCSALKQPWVQFDTVLVSASVLELVLRIANVEAELLQSVMLFRTLRLARLARTVRLMVQFATLWKLVQGMLYCINTLCWTFVMLGIMGYILALFGLELIELDWNLPLDHPFNVRVLAYFRNVGDAIMLITQLFGYDAAADAIRPLVKHQTGLLLYFAVVILSTSIALMNLVTAIMVEGALRMAEDDKEAKQAWEASRKKHLMEKLKVMFLELDEDGSGELSLDEVEMAPADVKDTLVELAGTEDLKGLFEMMDYDGGGTLATDEFCEGIFKAGKSDKPMEIERLMKQCSDIMHSHRKVKALLQGETSSSSSTKDTKDSEGSAARQMSSPKEQSVFHLSKLEDRMDGCEKVLTSMNSDMQKLTKALNNLSVPETSSQRLSSPSGRSERHASPLGRSERQASPLGRSERPTTSPARSEHQTSPQRRLASPKIKKAAAVCRGKSESAEYGHTLAGVRIHSSGRPVTAPVPRRKHEVHTWKAPADSDVSALNRRIAQLENRLASEGDEFEVEQLVHRVSQLEHMLALNSEGSRQRQ
eukprot:TRINITY_DN10032_c0_g1_i1.p1 TRINITY_DN10032_c0_g1~~TRINITY_DN10032_c0_g1_i1.p1  ORF type:complete len:704 (+),score=134.05 TRINITY_DN10032_c0_g1_i1:44-2155(+)